jgi:hypothetical protein
VCTVNMNECKMNDLQDIKFNRKVESVFFFCLKRKKLIPPLFEWERQKYGRKEMQKVNMRKELAEKNWKERVAQSVHFLLFFE